MTNPTEVEEIKTKIDNGDVKVKGQRKRKEKQAAPKTTTEQEKPAKSPKPQVEAKPAFPAECKLNKYGFIYLSDNVLTAWLGHGKGTEARLKIDLKDGNLLISKEVVK